MSIKPLNLYTQTPCDEDVFRALTAMLLNPAIADDIYTQVKDSFLVGVFEKRAEYFGVRVDKGVTVFVCGMLCRNPASVVMYLHAIYHHDPLGMNFGLNDLCELFPNGFPDDATLKQAWRAQKDPIPKDMQDNLIDNPEIFRARYTA